MIINKLQILFFACVLPTWLIAQNPQEEFNLYKNIYPNENGVYLKYIDKVDISLTRDEKQPIKITGTNTEELLLLNDNAPYYADRVLSSSHYANLSKFDAYSLNPEEKKYKKNKVKDILTGQSSDGMIFYDSVVEKRIYFSDVKKGSKTFISHTIDYPEPRMLRPYFFQTFCPTTEMRLEISVPNEVVLKWKIFNDDQQLIKLKTEVKKGKTIYTFIATNTARIKPETHSPDIRYYIPHLLFWIEKYTVNGESKAVLDGPQSLYNWKKHYLHGAIDDVSPALKELVDSLVKGETNELKKVKKIFYWVQDHIKYVAFEAGLEGFVPRAASKVCDRRYGDCKDMATIIVSMLKLAGIKGHLVWIGSRDLPYRYSVTPLPNISNHMIAMYKNGTENIFLDATGQFVPFGKPTSFIQGKEGFVAIDEEHFEIDTVPIVASSENQSIDSFFIEMSNARLVGRSKVSYTGYGKINLTHRMDGLKDEELKKYIEELCGLGSNKFQLNTYEIQNIHNRDLPLMIQTTFEVPDYTQTAGKEVYVNLNVDKSYSGAFIDLDQTKLPIENDYKSSYICCSSLAIPKNMVIDYIPENVSWKTDLFAFDIQYLKQDNKIIQTKKISVNYLILYPKDFETINSAIKKLNKAYNEVVILKYL